jgi:rhodanese-related sulfurtransferase
MTQTTSPNTATDTGPRHVDPKTASAWLTASQAALIDVREPAEFAAEHIAGAMLVPLSKFDARQLPDTGGQKLVLQCKSGARARQACARLNADRHPDVWVLEGGIEGWKQAGLPTVKAAGGSGGGMDLQRQTQLAIGLLVLAGTILSALVSRWFLVVTGLIGCGLVFAGLSGTCALGLLIARLPWNQCGAAKSCCSANPPTSK